MRHGRAKAARKTLQFFQLSQSMDPPYHVLLDGTFLVAVIKNKIPLRERLDRLLQHKGYWLYVTRSSLQELQQLAEQVQDETNRQLFGQARQWGLDECDAILEDKDIPTSAMAEDEDNSDLDQPGQDVLALIKASSSIHNGKMPSSSHHSAAITNNKYIVATQDDALLDILRHLGTTPLVRLARAVLLLENPSKQAQLKFQSKQEYKLTGAGSLQPPEQELVKIAKKQNQVSKTSSSFVQQSNNKYQQRHAKKAKGPNPLSCKKRKHGDAAPPQTRKRRRKNKTSASATMCSQTDS